ncbi:MAG: hypothetical protein DYG89_13930 [Caldilinea sp. CFX5]|nr:hypothetical protein [Caldilinea sp. CFX5]
MNLPEFGKQLQALRKARQWNQEALIEALDQLARRGPSEEYRVIDSTLLSRWERAHTQKGRTWKPTRTYMLHLIGLFAAQLDLAGAIAWAAQAGYAIHPAEVQAWFAGPSASPQASDAPTTAGPPLPPALADRGEATLFGIAAAQTELAQVLQAPTAPWLVALAGIGGIGKTTLATAVVQALHRATPPPFAKILWVSAKPEEFAPAIGGQNGQPTAAQPALDFATLIDELLRQLDPQANLLAPAPAKVAAVQERLRAQPHLLVVDNLETVADYATLLPALRSLSRPSKILLTTRHLPEEHEDLFCYALPELSAADAFALLRHEGTVRGLTPLRQATDAQLQPIYDVVGGNPLALKLVVGQLRLLPLAQVLHNLQAAQGKRIEALYTYIYWQAWQLLDERSRQLWLAMPIHPNVTFDHLLAVSGLDAEELAQGLEQLVTLSLVELAGDLTERRYRLHRLTETFLLNEVLKWSTAYMTPSFDPRIILASLNAR